MIENNIQFNRFGLPSDLSKVLIWAFVLRVILFFIVINSSDPFIISDDRSYEEISKTYLQYANSFWDWSAIYVTGGDGYLQVFWPYTICIFAKIFNTEYAGRILNIILSLLIIVQTYKLTDLIIGKHEKSLLAAKLMAFLPYPLIFSVFNIKDFYIMFGVIYTFRLFVTWQIGKSVTAHEIALCVLLLIGVFFARGGVVEFIGLIFGIFLAARFYRNRQFHYVFLCAIVALFGILYMWDSISASFELKLDDYGDTALEANGLRMIQMHSPAEFYKLPFQYLFSILTPFTTSFFGVLNDFTWLGLLTTCNVVMYPVAFGSLFYLFMKKHNALFYFSTFFIYIIITSLVLAIFRHYFFLFFLHVVSFTCFLDRDRKSAKNAMWACSSILFFFVLIMSFSSL